jgi:hypothetical protein
MESAAQAVTRSVRRAFNRNLERRANSKQSLKGPPSLKVVSGIPTRGRTLLFGDLLAALTGRRDASWTYYVRRITKLVDVCRDSSTYYELREHLYNSEGESRVDDPISSPYNSRNS